MTASLLALISVGLLGLVSTFCFVGCLLDSSGYGNPDPKPYTDYSKDVTSDASVVAYWPLNEPSPTDASGKIACLDAAGTNNGEYRHKGNDLDLFPIPGFNLTVGTDSAAATGFLQLGTVSLVAGDAKNNESDDLKTGMQTDGAVVRVPFSPVLNPVEFTVEAWVKPQWEADTPAYRAIVDSRDVVAGNFQGFVLWSKQNHQWEGVLADVNGVTHFVTSPDLIDLGEVAYLAFTFDGTNAVLFVNGEKVSPPVALSVNFNPNKAEELVIGAGAPWLDDRVAGVGDSVFPILPFSGGIQNVAIYNAALSEDTIKLRFAHGSGKHEVAG